MLAEGKTNKEIATALELSVYTVDAHRGRVMEKLNLHSIGELVRFAVRQRFDRLSECSRAPWPFSHWRQRFPSPRPAHHVEVRHLPW